MVKERDSTAPRPSVGPNGQPQQFNVSGNRSEIGAQDGFGRPQQAPACPSQFESRPAPTQKPLFALTGTTPEFGKSSPLRNPLAKTNNLFNVPRPGQSRPEHHREKHSISGEFKNPPGVPGASVAKPPLYPLPAAYVARQQAQAQAQARLKSSPDVVEIPKPRNFPQYTTQPAPRPMFSTKDFAPRPTVDLTGSDDDDAINADDAFKNDDFGAADPYQYVDASQANENIKALLEGALEEDDEEVPKLRRTKRKAKKGDDGLNSLTSKLKALDVKEEAPEDEEEEEVDDGTVDGLKVKLLPHQVDGVAWMTDKEIGKKKTKGVFPKGGILADDMGLGKTIQSLALILTNPLPPLSERSSDKKHKIPEKTAKSTLVVAPLALIKQWEAEIKDKVEKSHALRALVHHGPKRTMNGKELEKYDVVVTTYQILASEHASSSDSDDGPKIGCFGVQWYRVILDEAHTIKNRNAKSTQACYALRSHFRWCLTGTPMQNNLDELQSLIRFLRIKPYCDLAPWKAQITGPMKNGRGGLAMRRLQYVLKAFMKRRTKDVLKKEGALNPGGKAKAGDQGFKIVERKVEIVSVPFDPVERQFYERLNDRAQRRLNEIMRSEKTDYLGALTLLLRLRQACNHPDLTAGNSQKDKDALTAGASIAPSGVQTPTKAKSAPDDVDDIADLFGGLSVAAKKCDVCQKVLHNGDAAEGSIRCLECDEDLALQSARKHREKHKHQKHKKDRKSRHSHKDGDAPKPKPRQRPVLLDSDDEEEGDWIVPESQRDTEDLGKAGGTDDEDAEGGGETLGTLDSETDGDDDESIVRPERRVMKQPTPEDDTASSEDEESDDSASRSDAESDSSMSAIADYDEGGNLLPSTKIRHLVKILHKESKEHKFIVFSQFTSMLDIVEPFLKREGFIFTRYDGSMRNDLREASLNKLRNDPKCRVLLCSLKCGSLGLNLTAASRVVILEPFWNPFVEEQAIDRVHRLNQTVDVHIYRLTIKDTVEQRILDLQEAKRNLAAAALEGGAKALNKLSMNDILMLFKSDYHADTEGHAMNEQVGDLLGKTRVLDSSPTKKVWTHESEFPRNGRVQGNGRGSRAEDSVYGRR